MKVKGMFISTLLVIDTFFISYAVGLNSHPVLVVDPSLPPVVPKVADKPKADAKKPEGDKGTAGKGKEDKKSEKSASDKNAESKTPPSKAKPGKAKAKGSKHAAHAAQ